MWNELGISGGTAIIILIALYFVIKWAVKNGPITDKTVMIIVVIITRNL